MDTMCQSLTYRLETQKPVQLALDDRREHWRRILTSFNPHCLHRSAISSSATVRFEQAGGWPPLTSQFLPFAVNNPPLFSVEAIYHPVHQAGPTSVP